MPDSSRDEGSADAESGILSATIELTTKWYISTYNFSSVEDYSIELVRLLLYQKT